MKHFPRAVVGVLVTGLSFTAGTRAQTPTAAVVGERRPGPIVDFTVVTSTGLPVTDLAASEVAIRVDGRTRRVRQLRQVSAAPPPAAAGAAPLLTPPYGTNGGS